MNFELTKEQQMVRDMVRDFAENEIAPNAIHYDKTAQFPEDVFKKMGELGLLGIPFPEEYGGSGGDTISYALAVEEVGRACGGTGLSYAAAVSLGASPIYYFGTERQKQEHLVPLATGESLGSFGLTEPNAGSDAGGTRTKAVLEGDEYVINGEKCWITNAGYARTVIVTAVTGKDERGKPVISALIVPTGIEGFTISCNYDKMGVRASNTCELVLEDVRVPKENLLGDPTKGFKQFLYTLDGGRISIGALAVGIAQAAFDRALAYANERKQFGQKISSFQAIQFKLADMAMEIELARNMVLKAAWLKDQKKPFTKEGAYAKLYASETAMRTANQAIQIHGGYGYMQEYEVERMLRDAKLLEIGEGTSEIQRMVIARQLGCR
ncbi:acyl-CoA dehydrogenase [Halalkalibacterium halodurans]|jgi:alkylation response protein AidB-like acyl-CoA dehydrogenase|uniref:Butyryl-CoA dehydrogenase n=1 Tax=Halalkalibacterium halodurans (strain ATCC BAA-125 / DSM 18197 / FERM 7344 / JCM 9153 / C-125) TaxID=272558 RepID=Q9KDT1_HALH5|nr:acyl-CoA dehydrogenase [Halalkalibacterium halodurans]MED4079333.1 acyl-CoA dehydrogenase [Halalkalibacterium halodurans]MED4085404.1 acyl-CoA dehydrogenase [Halalkalibacterium halodurans]MED4104472.1 acyl-CoA dehydrogenase [Halalkalibacterium halodurans]MED4108149.1 acyl-CoA dehydrogenase [Halalkalibacterium halodurans]MED4124341.1 acyl-CoA dehydrogenase [Halalkalibacterium halodurans]